LQHPYYLSLAQGRNAARRTGLSAAADTCSKAPVTHTSQLTNATDDVIGYQYRCGVFSLYVDNVQCYLTTVSYH